MMADLPRPRRRMGAWLPAFVALAWAGMVIGVSGLATPVKFSAPSLTLPVALDVGRVTFHLFSRVEWGLALLLVLLGLTSRLRLLWLPVGLVVALVALQAIWLLPALDARVAMVIAGNAPPPSQHHLAYVAAEAAKLVALLAIGIGALRNGEKPSAAMPG